MEKGKALLPDVFGGRHQVRHHHRFHTGGVSGEDAIGAVFEYKAVLGRGAQFPGSQKENIRRRLPALDLITAGYGSKNGRKPVTERFARIC